MSDEGLVGPGSTINDDLINRLAEDEDERPYELEVPTRYRNFEVVMVEQ